MAADATVVEDRLLPSNRDLRRLFEEERIAERFGSGDAARVFICGKLGGIVRETLAGGSLLHSAAALWLAAQARIALEPESVQSLAVIEISASGYTLIGIDRQGRLKNDLLVVNPRCGAGTGINIDRILQKLGLDRAAVDELLAGYLGESGGRERRSLLTRADRCGVFSSSATISDKNQGIPLAVALGTTLKSEVLKTCRRLPAGFDMVLLAGRFFHWQFARDCAGDLLADLGVARVAVDADNTFVLDALRTLVTGTAMTDLVRREERLFVESSQAEYPAFADLRRRLVADGHFVRLDDLALSPAAAAVLATTPVHLALDVGSTMAKVVIAGDDERPLFIASYSNAGDTVETVKQIWRDLQGRGLTALEVLSIGITGSARFQVREALCRIYPALSGRVEILVENYAHAHGSIDVAREQVARLKAAGVAELNEDFCILVDVGGEDTKISTIALSEAELFNNAMNIKCSAGTGSLMDTLAALFGIASAAEANAAALAADRGHAINATCAVFLMENAQKLQARGVPRSEILASAIWAIVENMARTLWNQVQLPRNTVLLLHGQTMLSDPLPLAVTHRFHGYHGQPSYAVVPPNPGHRACFGLIRSQRRAAPVGSATMPLAGLVDAHFEKRIIQCKGAACDDPEAVCNRTSLRCQDAQGRQFSFSLGGCTAINELFARAGERKAGRSGGEATVEERPQDCYKQLWDYVDSRMPRSTAANRLVIARSFVVSEWAYFLATLFADLGLPVHVDTVREADLVTAQPLFNIDSCAPHMGAVGQYRRLAAEPHGFILAPQIERLDTDGRSLGRTCTLNQGGVAVAANLATVAVPAARFKLFSLDLGRLEAGAVAAQLADRLADVFASYGIAPSGEQLQAAAARAIEAQRALKRDLAERAAAMMAAAEAGGFPVALVVAREYMQNPGIYDSHVRRLLRDKRLVVIPSYVLDVDLDEEFDAVYWRNPHFILTVLKAVAERRLHSRLRHPGLAEAFRRIESGPTLLPVVQVSTFCCGPDSVTAHRVAEVMKRRPFLLIQSDAVIKELAHLENRVNTYVRQLDLGLHGKLRLDDGAEVDVRALDDLENDQPIDRQRDVIYIPSLADNRVLTSVLRGAGYRCFDNYGDQHPTLEARIKLGRSAAGDAVCAPLAAVYGDLLAAMEDFTTRRSRGELSEQARLLYFNNKGSGPCRQGQYVEVHKLLSHKHLSGNSIGGRDDGCAALPGGQLLRFLVAHEANGYDFGVEDWVLLRFYLGAILQGVLQEVHFSAAWACRDYDDYQRFLADFRELKEELYAALAAFSGPGRLAQGLLRSIGQLPVVGDVVRLFAFRLYDRSLVAPLRRFSRRWPAAGAGNDFRVAVSGEVYMRVAQSEEIFRILLANLGFRRFSLHSAPVWSYLEYLLEEAADEARTTPGLPAGEVAARCRRVAVLRFLLRHWLAAPLYRAAKLAMPVPAAQTMAVAREVLPTLRPQGELGPYVGEALLAMRGGVDLLLNVAPGGCMVSAMAEVLTPKLLAARTGGGGSIQHLFSTEGEVDEALLTQAVLKALGPQAYFSRGGTPV